MIRAFLFDFGRVISAQRPESLFRRYERDLGLAPGSINRIMFDCPAWRETLVGRLSEDAYWRAVAPDLGLRSPERLRAFRERYRADERVNPQVRELARRLHGRYELAVLSNAPAGLDRWLEAWDMLHLFRTVFCSAEQGVAKPRPEAYLRTLERLGVRPDESVFIDDTPENVRAADALGVLGILFTDYRALAEALRSRIDPGLLPP